MVNTEEFTGEDLKTLRKKHKLTQTELGEWLGLQKQSISRWENGRGEISIPFQRLFQLFFEKIEKKF